MNREEIRLLTDDALISGLADRLRIDIDRTIELAHFVSEMHDRGFDLKKMDAGRVSRYRALSEGRISPATYQKFATSLKWLSVFMRYGAALQDYLLTEKIPVLIESGGRMVRQDLTFDQMQDSHRDQVFDKSGPRDIESQLAWLDDRNRARDDAAMRASGTLEIDKAFLFEDNNPEAEAFKRLKSATILNVLRAQGLLQSKKRKAS